MRWLQRVGTGLVACAALLAARSASASPADDVRRGASVLFRTAHLEIDDKSLTAGGLVLSKAPGTLDGTINTADLGADFSMNVHMHGIAVGNVITWTFDETLPVPQEVAFDTHLTRLAGQLVARVDHISEDTDPTCNTSSCPYSVVLTALPTSSVTAYGTAPFWTTWSRTSTELQFQMLGGLPRPILNDLEVDVPSRLCAVDRDRYFTGRVTIATPAPDGGGVVRLMSDRPEFFPDQRVNVDAYRTQKGFLVRIPAGFGGDVTMWAAAGGAARTVPIHVQKQCLQQLGYTLRDILPRKKFPPWVIDDLRILDHGEAAARVADQWYLADANQNIYPADEVLGFHAKEIFPTFLRDLYGMGDVPKLGFSAFQVRPDDGKVIPIPGFSIQGVSSLGTAFGAWTQKAPMGAYYNGSELFSLAVGKESGITTSSGGMLLAGQYTKDQVQRGFVFYGDKPFDIGGLGGETRVTAANSASDVVGWTRDIKGRSRAFLLSRGKKLKVFDAVPSYAQKAVGIDDNGLAVVNALDAKGKPDGVYLVGDSIGVVSLKSLLPDQSFSPIEALSMTGGGDVVARGYLEGKLSIVALTAVWGKKS